MKLCCFSVINMKTTLQAFTLIFFQHRYRRTDATYFSMFSLAKMLPIFDVRCANRPNSTYNRLWNLSHVTSTPPRQRRQRRLTITWAHSCECIPALRCHECHRPPFSCNSSIVSSFWTSVLATGRLSTSAVHVCCPNTWTNFYF